MQAETQPFLSPIVEQGQQREILATSKHIPKSTSPTYTIWVGIAVFINAIFLISLALWVAPCPTTACSATQGEGLADLQLRYVPTKSTDFTQTPYFGTPGAAADAAWEELLSGMFIRATKEELNAADQSSIILPDGGEQLAWLGVFHDLHCINTLRRWIHHDHYYPNLTATEFDKFQSHTNHCLDMLRQTIQCHADTYPMTFRWTESEQKPVFNPKTPVRTCIDFNLLRESLKPRSVGLEEIRGLKNPMLSKGI